MRIIPLLPLTLTLALALAACAPTPAADRNLDALLQNPLFAERYADELVDAVVELKIQNDPILETKHIADVVEQNRTRWLQTASDATKKQREGTSGTFTVVHAEGRGEFLYLNDMLYTGPDLQITPGPDLEVYMTTVLDPRDVAFPDNTAIRIGRLESPYGAQSYKVEHQNDPYAYRTVVIWDETLGRIWGFVQLNK